MKFIREYESNRIEMDIPDYLAIDEVLKEFENFLRACGYVIEYSKVLDLVNTDEQ
jgi:hypothetical protein